MKNPLHKFIIISIVLVFTIPTTQAREEHFGEKQWAAGVTYEVSIMNGFENSRIPLNVHCQSKDDDIGKHTLHTGQEFHWKFKVRWDGSTLYYCDVEWNKVTKHFDAFDAMSKDLSCLNVGNCFWLVSEAGFYLSTDEFTWVPQFQWNA